MEEKKTVRLKYTGSVAARYWHGGGTRRVEPGEVVDMPECLVKARLKEKCWVKVSEKKSEKKGGK